jgi:8-oxo-dGTP pyrophosphatase MutT (NUDIX family)
MLRVKDLIIAAGGIVMQNGRVLLVHRPRYNDWSLPKGKLDDGESPLETAIREVREETGYEVEPREFAGSCGYLVKGRPKTVLYWTMTPRKQFEIEDREEVSELLWLSVEEAMQRLSYALEQEILEKAAASSRS